MPGWNEKTFGLRDYDQIPQKARDYIARLEALCGIPIVIVSTGPDRNETIVLQDLF